MRNLIVLGCAALMLASCASSPRNRIESQLRDIGLDRRGAQCLARDMDETLNRRELDAVADFLKDLNRADTPGNAVDALLTIDDPRIAAMIARASVKCAFSRD